MGRQVHVTSEAAVGFEDAARVMADDYREVLGAATAAAREHVLAMIDNDPTLAGLAVGDDVTVEADDPHVTWNAAMATELRWRADDRATLFSSLRGVIEISGAAEDRSGLMFVGTFAPPDDGPTPLTDLEHSLPVARAAVEKVLVVLGERLSSATTATG